MGSPPRRRSRGRRTEDIPNYVGSIWNCVVFDFAICTEAATLRVTKAMAATGVVGEKLHIDKMSSFKTSFLPPRV